MDSEKQSVDGHAKDAHGRPTTGTHDIQSDNLEFGGHDQLSRGLKSRHIQFLALGGAIGTGLEYTLNHQTSIEIHARSKKHRPN